MIIDYGFNMEETKERMLDIFKRHDLDFDNTILYLTHLHSDHVGLATFLQGKGVEVYISQVDGYIVNNPDVNWGDTYRNAILQGSSEDNFKIEEHPGYKYAITENLEYKEAVIGNTLNIGDYEFEIIDLSGHTPGITGLYEKNTNCSFAVTTFCKRLRRILHSGALNTAIVWALISRTWIKFIIWILCICFHRTENW